MHDLSLFLSLGLKILGNSGYPVPRDLLDRAARLGVKTLGYFEGTLDRLARQLFDGNLDQLEFVQILEDLISGQLRRAWMDGMATNGLTQVDMTPDLQSQLDTIIQNEYASISDFADYIVEKGGRTDVPRETGLGDIYSRADIWTNRYNDVVNQATLASANALQKMVWHLGQTEQHCTTCKTLDGVVATVAAWLESGYKPQSPPNGMLECGGWRCDCRFEPTEETVTEGGIPNA